MPAWTANDIPDQTGRHAIVTGANAGIGFETALVLAQRGATVTLACRNPEKGADALARIEAVAPGRASLASLDLSDLDSVKAFSAQYAATHDRLDLLILNAGVMVPPLGRTKQGFELQFGTNHLGHFALTHHLLPALQATAGSRVVVVYSGVHHGGQIDFDDLNWEKKSYNAWAAYSQSKLANVLFALELQRRLTAAGASTIVTAAHPGYTATDLQRTSTFARLLNPLVAMKAADGALPTLRAACDPTATPGSSWGPQSFLMEMRGPPGPGKLSKRAQDPDLARRLWTVSEQLVGLHYDLPA